MRGVEEVIAFWQVSAGSTAAAILHLCPSDFSELEIYFAYYFAC